MKHIVQIIDDLAIGGAQKLIATLANNFPYDHAKLSVISLDRPLELMEDIRIAGADVQHLPAPGLLNVKRIGKLARYLRQHKVDVVHTHLTYANIVGGIASKLSGISQIATLHNVKSEPLRDGTIHQRLETLILRFCSSKIIAVGHVVAKSHQARWPKHAISVVPNVVEIPETLPAEKRDSMRYDLTGGISRPLFIAVGRLTAAKGHTDLLAAFSIVVKKHPDVFLTIVGDGKLRDELSRYIKSNALQNNVRLLGKRGDVVDLLRASDVFVSASIAEGMPLAVLEAMAAGLPVIATNVGDVSNILNQTGIVTKPSEPTELAIAMSKMVELPELRTSLGSAARKMITERYSIDLWTKQLFHHYSTCK